MLYTLIPFLPLAAFLVLGLGGARIKEQAHLVAVPAVLLSCLLSISAFTEVASGSVISVPLYTWLTSGNLDVHIGLYIDRLTAVMLLLVTIVSSLVHIYTIGYMHGEPGYARFFSYIALFTFSMLMLVLADNLLQLFVFWEAVGLCSYLLGSDQSLSRQSRRRLRLSAGPPAGLVQLRLAELSRHFPGRT
jgi:NADH-quinone oxidoreductase subunit L